MRPHVPPPSWLSHFKRPPFSHLPAHTPTRPLSNARTHTQAGMPPSLHPCLPEGCSSGPPRCCWCCQSFADNAPVLRVRCVRSSTSDLRCYCTQCRYTLPHIETPLFVLNSGYDPVHSIWEYSHPSCCGQPPPGSLKSSKSSGWQLGQPESPSSGRFMAQRGG